MLLILLLLPVWLLILRLYTERAILDLGSAHWCVPEYFMHRRTEYQENTGDWELPTSVMKMNFVLFSLWGQLPEECLTSFYSHVGRIIHLFWVFLIWCNVIRRHVQWGEKELWFVTEFDAAGQITAFVRMWFRKQQLTVLTQNFN